MTKHYLTKFRQQSKKVKKLQILGNIIVWNNYQGHKKILPLYNRQLALFQGQIKRPEKFPCHINIF